VRWFGFVLSVRFCVFAWIAILFVGVTPLPPVAELLILAGWVASEFQRRHASGAFRGDFPLGLVQAAPAIRLITRSLVSVISAWDQLPDMAQLMAQFRAREASC
jgi:hypothetical protein